MLVNRDVLVALKHLRLKFGKILSNVIIDISRTKLPSQRVFFTPLSGQLDAAFKLNPPAGPPLSVEKMIILSRNMPLFCRASTTWPTD